MSMEIENICDKIVEYFIAKYTNQSAQNLELIKDWALENERMNAYHGRELLELLQNVDDAYLELCDNDPSKIGQDVKCQITYKDNKLTIANTGTYFTEDTINRLCQGGVSSKSGKYIGNKGTGFRSVLNWAKNKSIEIHSGGFHIKFSREYADNKFAEIKDQEVIKRQIKDKPNLFIPMLSCPQDISKNESFDYNGFDTVIVIDVEELNDDYDIKDQINKFDSNILLFLQTITNIEFISCNEKKTFHKSPKNGIFTISEQNNEKEPVSHDYRLFDNSDNTETILIDGEEKEIRLSVAIPVSENSDNEYKLYCFFPIRNAICPFPALLHATFLLNQSRDTIDIDSGGANKNIVAKLLKFYVETVTNNFAKSEFSDMAVKLLTPNNTARYNWKFSSDFGKFGLESHYLDLLKDKKFLPTVNNDYIAITDKPKLFETEFPRFFKGDHFSKLLKLLETKENYLLKILAEKNNIELDFSDKELCSVINLITDTLEISNQVEIFAWWQDKYQRKDCSILPNLLKDDNGKWLEYGKEYYFLSGQQLQIPHWVKIPLLKKEYQQALFDFYKNDESIQRTMKESNDPIDRVLVRSGKIKSVKFSYRDRSNIIASVNSSVKNNYQHSVDFIKWLWKNYKKEGGDWNPPQVSDDTYKFPTANRSVQSSQKLYFDKSYGNELAEYLFISDDHKAFAPLSEFGIKEDEKADFYEFIAKFGVLSYPKIEEKKITPDNDYQNLLKRIIQRRESYDIQLQKFELPFIDNFSKILVSSENWVIIKWIVDNEQLFNTLRDSYRGTINYGRSYNWNLNYTDNIPNYLIYVIKNTEWLKLVDEKLAPKKCLITGRNANKFSELLPILQDDYFNDIAKECKVDIKQVKEIFGLFEMPMKITDLPSNEFYGLLLHLPEKDLSGDLMKVIYRELEQGETNKEFEDSDNKRKFFEEGKVFVRQGNQRTWHKANESYFPSTKIIDTNNFPIIDKSQRSGNFTDFNNIFGIQEYKGDYKVVENTAVNSASNNEFQTYFKEFMKHAKPFGEKNENIQKYISQLNIQLVSQIKIKEKDNVITVKSNYTVIRRANTKWYIVIDEFNINELSKYIEQIFENIANTPGSESFINQIGELFRTDNIENRNFLIQKEFGTLDVLTDNHEHNSIKINFEETLKKIHPNYNIAITIDWANFDSEDNTPKIIEIMKAINSDIPDFTEQGFQYEINLIPYWKNEIKKYLNLHRSDFESKLYADYKEKPVDEIKIFQEEINMYIDFEPNDNEIANSIKFDIEKFCKSKFDFEFSDSVDLSVIYDKNVAAFQDNKDKDELQEFLNNNQIKSLLYFYDNDNVKTEVNVKWKDHIKKIEPEKQSSNKENTHLNINEIPTAEISTNENIKFDKVEETEHKKGSHLAHSSRQSQKQQQASKRIGDTGELIAYKKLVEIYREAEVQPKAKVFADKGIIALGQADDSFGCDIVVNNDDGTQEFYEIKTGNNEFYLSQSEFDLANKDKKHFHLWFITDYETSPKIHEIPTDDFIKNSKPIIEKYKCKVNIKE